MSWSTDGEYEGQTIQGLEVYTSDDERIGTIDQVLVNTTSQQRYLLVKTGPFGGALPTRELYIPSAAVSMLGEDRVIVEATGSKLRVTGGANRRRASHGPNDGGRIHSPSMHNPV